MSRDELPDLIQRFFAHYLVSQRNLSAHTRDGYRDTFRLFLSFLSRQHRRPIDQLTLDTISPATVLAFLDYLETTRRNATRTRNLRLAAIRTFVRFVLGQTAGVEFIAIGHRILAIPQKKSPKPILGFMTREEIDAVLVGASVITCSSPSFTTLAHGFQRLCNFVPETCSITPSIFVVKVARTGRCPFGLERNGGCGNGAKPTTSHPTS